MNARSRFYPLILLLAALTGLSSCELFPNFPGMPGKGDDKPERQPTITELASGEEDLSLLVEALQITGLDGLLDRPGQYTVFAPQNAAFEALLAGNDEWSGLEDIPVDLLTRVLKTHVLPREFFARDLETNYFKTLAPGPDRGAIDLFVNTASGVLINGSVSVRTPDVDASNGVVHIVDRVINPSDLVTLAAANPAFSILVEALQAEGLGVDFLAALSGEGPLTVVAPVNQAFLDLLDSNPEWSGLEDIPADLLTEVLLYHVAPGNFRFRDLIRRPVLNTLLENNSWTTRLRVNRRKGLQLNVVGNTNRAVILQRDVQGVNGVIHGIDTVLLP